MQQLTSEELKQKIKSGENFVLDLFATWCGPCKVMLNNLERVNETLIKESNGSPSFGIYKFDVDSDHEFVRQEMNIRAVPTLKLYRNGELELTKTGVVPTPELTEMLTM